MKEFLLNNQTELISSSIVLFVLVLLRFILGITIRRIGRFSDLKDIRTRLVLKYISIGLMALGAAGLIFIWGVNIREIGLIFSSIFAVIGVALFAQWSILSNVTAGIILFFSFPFKIGDRITIMDKEMEEQGPFLIEDIRAYHIHLRKGNGELMTYPNNMLLQKAVSIARETADLKTVPDET
ncbi:mechanosensitive ion channel domain-containing protein [Poritiphilus flavus]|uniref:Mechanosensitive ion channel n=1 Tax=Poritiphilus flavus TaxID=2697053 RepID=A0A6L9EE20_9FLAO|nr:mechanosensitive ion channel domain-containing protein [Poritiphilus flavus]NAS12970.1 mechanosensitive ion channel [Poritiphilus flavus]